MTLASRYRPDTFTEVAGQESSIIITQEAVRRFEAGDFIPTTWLFEGPHGSGKTSLARVFARALRCTNRAPGPDRISPDPCNDCEACATDPETIDAGRYSGVDDTRRLVARLHDEARPGPARVVILDECHAFSPEAWTAMLQLLESPPEDLLVFLLTTEPQRLPDNVLSRCTHLHFLPLTTDDIIDRLDHIAQAEEVDFDEPGIEAIAEQADGDLRAAILSFDQVAAMGAVTLDTAEAVYRRPNLAPAFLDAITAGDVDRAMSVADSYGRRLPDPSYIARDCIEYLADRLVDARNPRDVLDSITALWELDDRLSRSRLSTSATLASALASLRPLLGDTTVRPTRAEPGDGFASLADGAWGVLAGA